MMQTYIDGAGPWATIKVSPALLEPGNAHCFEEFLLRELRKLLAQGKRIEVSVVPHFRPSLPEQA